MADPQPIPVTMDVLETIPQDYFVVSLITSTSNVLSRYAETEVSFQDILGNGDTYSFGDYAILIDFYDDCHGGNMAIGMPEGLAMFLTSRMLGIKPDALTREHILDCLGEVLNVIAGQVKQALFLKGVSHFQLSVPRPFVGEEVEQLDFILNDPYLTVRLETEGYSFIVQITCLREFVSHSDSAIRI